MYPCKTNLLHRLQASLMDIKPEDLKLSTFESEKTEMYFIGPESFKKNLMSQSFFFIYKALNWPPIKKMVLVLIRTSHLRFLLCNFCQCHFFIFRILQKVGNIRSRTDAEKLVQKM